LFGSVIGVARLTGFDDAALKEQFSVTYLRAVAYAAGAVVDEPRVDRDSIDVFIRAMGQVGPKRSPSVDAQLKCHTGGPDEQGELVYDLKIKNYRDLIPTNHLVPRILIVVCVPDDVADHAKWTPEQLELRRCGYWKYLGGQPAVPNETKVRVKLTEPLSPDALVGIFHDIANGRIR
jgi:Domain of unknown function (DUF4365)